MTTKEGKGGRWRPGESGNARGRPKGSGEVARLRQAIAEHVPDILAQLVEAAKGGDVQAARLLLERVCAPLKAAEQATPVQLVGETLTARGLSVIGAVEEGALAPSQGAALIAALGQLARVAEVDELEARIAALEARQESTGGPR